MRLRLSFIAVNQLCAIRDYIGRDNPQAAHRTSVAILAAVDRLEQFPFIGRIGRQPGSRELVVNGFPYIVGYRVEGDVIDVFSIVHTSRKWPEIE